MSVTDTNEKYENTNCNKILSENTKKVEKPISENIPM